MPPDTVEFVGGFHGDLPWCVAIAQPKWGEQSYSIHEPDNKAVAITLAQAIAFPLFTDKAGDHLPCHTYAVGAYPNPVPKHLP